MEALYFESWDKAMNATAAAGGSIAHHHGSGRLRRSYLHHDLGTSGLKLLRSMKDAIDPKGIMNAGNLLE
jgi:alkyldihydroxyacetonephosphate synthase